MYMYSVRQYQSNKEAEHLILTLDVWIITISKFYTLHIYISKVLTTKTSKTYHLPK